MCMYRNPIPNIKSIATLCNMFGSLSKIPFVRNFMFRELCQKIMGGEEQEKDFEGEFHRLRSSHNFPFAIALIMNTATMLHVMDRPTVGHI